MHPSLAAFGAAGGLPPWSDTVVSPATPCSLPSSSPEHTVPPAVASPQADADSAPAHAQDPSPDAAPPVVAPVEHAVSQPASVPHQASSLPEAEDDCTTTSTTTFPFHFEPSCESCSTTTTTTVGPPAAPVTLACAIHGDRPRCVRLHPRDHIAQALWQILSWAHLT